jgi:hypothetical protein
MGRHVVITADVVVRRRDGSLCRYERRPGEDVEGFAARAAAQPSEEPSEEPSKEPSEEPSQGQPGGTDLAVLVSGDVGLPDARVYALHPYGLGAARLLDAADPLSVLAPAPAAVTTRH